MIRSVDFISQIEAEIIPGAPFQSDDISAFKLGWSRER